MSLFWRGDLPAMNIGCLRRNIDLFLYQSARSGRTLNPTIRAPVANIVAGFLERAGVRRRATILRWAKTSR